MQRKAVVRYLAQIGSHALEGIVERDKEGIVLLHEAVGWRSPWGTCKTRIQIHKTIYLTAWERSREAEVRKEGLGGVFDPHRSTGRGLDLDDLLLRGEDGDAHLVTLDGDTLAQHLNLIDVCSLPHTCLLQHRLQL